MKASDSALQLPVPRNNASHTAAGDAPANLCRTVCTDVVTEDSPAAKLLRGAQLGGLVEVMCCQIGAVRQEDLADFHLGLAESASQTDRSVDCPVDHHVLKYAGESGSGGASRD